MIGAVADGDFASEGDVTRYRVAVATAGPYQVTAEVRYQSIGYRWASNLERYKAPEPARFVEYYRRDAADSAVTMATAPGRFARTAAITAPMPSSAVAISAS